MRKRFMYGVGLGVLLFFALGFVVVGNARPVAADVDALCGDENTPFYLGTLPVPADSYDVYVKLGKASKQTTVTSYATSDADARCVSVGTAKADSTSWHKLGVLRQSAKDANVTLQLSSEALADLPDANRPSLMLVSKTNPVCVPKLECVAIIAGQTAYIRPAGNALENDALHVVRVGSVDLENVTKVQYYVDNELLYETKTLQEFRDEDIPFYASKLVRVVQYTSGQTAVIEQKAPEISHDNLWTTLQRYAKKYRNTLLTFASLVGIIVVIRVTLFVASRIRQRRQWKISHGFIREEADNAVTPEQIRKLRLHLALRTAYRYGERIVVVLAVAAGFVFVSNAFFLQVGTVSGLSMWSTLDDGQKILINKTPVTFARLNNNRYLPKRGDIIVASPNFGALDASLEQDDESLIVKRVIGLPGERVVVTGHSLTVYNTDNPNGFDPDVSGSWAADVQREASVESMNVTLGENEVFLAGDNRPVSIDSRYNGPISTNQIVGYVMWY